MRVLHIMANFSVGGSTETVLSLAEGLKSKGYNVEIYSGLNTKHEGSMLEYIQAANYSITFSEYLVREIRPIKDFHALIGIYRFLKANKFDIVHCHTSKAGVLGRIAAHLAGVPVILFTYHGLPFHQFQPRIINILYRLFEKFAGLFSHKVTCVASVIRERIIKHKIVFPENAVVIRSAFDLESFRPNPESRKLIREQLGLSDDTIVFGKIGRFAVLKGHRFLVEAVERIAQEGKRCKVICMGNGILEEEIKELVMKRGLTDYFIFAGLIDPGKIPQWMNAMDVLVHTSLLEGLARIFPQSIEMEKPIITFDLDGAPEVVKNGENGFLVPAGDIVTFAEKMAFFISQPDKIQSMGKAGKAMIGNEFDVQKMIDETDQLYRSFSHT